MGHHFLAFFSTAGSFITQPYSPGFGLEHELESANAGPGSLLESENKMPGTAHLPCSSIPGKETIFTSLAERSYLVV